MDSNKHDSKSCSFEKWREAILKDPSVAVCDTDYLSVYLLKEGSTEVLNVSYAHEKIPELPINFCPVCGRDLRVIES